MIGGRKTRSNKGVKRGPRTGRTRSGKRFRPTAKRAVRRTRKQRSNKGVRRGPYGPRTGRTRSGRRFRQAGGCGFNRETAIKIHNPPAQSLSWAGENAWKQWDKYAELKAFVDNKCQEGPPPCEPMESEDCLKEPTCHWRGDNKCVDCTEQIFYGGQGCKSAPGVTPKLRQ